MSRVDPFEGERPRWIRVVAYRYRFATRAERREHSVVWMRDHHRVILDPVTLSDRPDPSSGR
ncbi:hypothetical protein [Microbacterium paludicola]|uniref:hypothetical protein n=1 Tax=Microbacterium paludicola TaxID=300019 RepID=UPI0031DDFA20